MELKLLSTEKDWEKELTLTMTLKELQACYDAIHIISHSEVEDLWANEDIVAPYDEFEVFISLKEILEIMGGVMH